MLLSRMRFHQNGHVPAESCELSKILSQIALPLKKLCLLQAMKILVQIIARHILNLYIQGRKFYFHLMFRLQNIKKKISFS